MSNKREIILDEIIFTSHPHHPLNLLKKRVERNKNAKSEFVEEAQKELGISSKVVPDEVKLTCPDCGGFDITMNATHNIIPTSEQFLWTCRDCNFQFGDATTGGEG